MKILLAILGLACIIAACLIPHHHHIMYFLALSGACLVSISLNKKLWIDEPY